VTECIRAKTGTLVPAALVAALAAVLAAGCTSQMSVNEQPLAQVLAFRLEAQEVTPGTSLSKMCRVYNASEGLVRRLNSASRLLGRGDTITGTGTILLPRVSCDVVLDIRRKLLKVTSGTTVIRVYPVRFGPRAAQLRASYYIVERKLKRKAGEQKYPYLGTRAIYMRGGLVIHGGAPEVDPLVTRYEEDTVKAQGACVQISNKNVEELYDLLEKSATVLLSYD